MGSFIKPHQAVARHLCRIRDQLRNIVDVFLGVIKQKKPSIVIQANLRVNRFSRGKSDQKKALNLPVPSGISEG